MSKFIKRPETIKVFASNALKGDYLPVKFGTNIIIGKDEYEKVANDNYEYGLESLDRDFQLRDLNSMEFYSNSLLAYLFQQGVPEFSAFQNYPEGAVVTYDGKVWVATKDIEASQKHPEPDPCHSNPCHKSNPCEKNTVCGEAKYPTPPEWCALVNHCEYDNDLEEINNKFDSIITNIAEIHTLIGNNSTVIKEHTDKLNSYYDLIIENKNNITENTKNISNISDALNSLDFVKSIDTSCHDKKLIVKYRNSSKEEFDINCLIDFPEDNYIVNGRVEKAVDNSRTLILELKDGGEVSIPMGNFLEDNFLKEATFSLNKTGSHVDSITLKLEMINGSLHNLNLPVEIVEAINKINTYTQNPSKYIQNVVLQGTDLVFKYNDGSSDITVNLSNLSNSIDTDTVVTNLTLDGNILKLHDSKGNILNVDLSSLNGTGGSTVKNSTLVVDDHTIKLTDTEGTTLSAGLPKTITNVEVNSGQLILTYNDGSHIQTNIPTGVDTNTTNASLTLSGSVLTLTDSEGNSVNTNLSSIAGSGSGTDANTTVQSLVLTGNTLKLTDSDGNEVTVDLSSLNTGSSGGSNLTVATVGSVADTTGTELPTTIIGTTASARQKLLGNPDAFMQVEIAGETYYIPAYKP